jgi:hypothetical protein
VKNPAVDLLAIATPYLLWPAFDDISPTSGRVSFYVLQGLFICYIGWRLKVFAGWRWIPVMVYGFFVGGQQAICGLLFEHSGKHVCDAGTGFPWILLTVTALAIFAAYYARRSSNV